MHQRIPFCLLLFVGLTFAAASVNVSGKVTNKAGSPIANAIVTLVKQAMKDTTGSDGAYSLQKTVSVLPLLAPNNQSITLYKGFLDFSLPNPSPVKVEIFDVQGILLKKELKQNVVTGFYRFNIKENSRTAKILVIRASIGQDAVTFRYLPLSNGNYMVNQSNESGATVDEKGLLKITAINDTLRTTAANYTTNVKAINSYSQVVNITLDTAGGGGAKQSPGCGKATTLTKDKDTYVDVTAGSAGARMYIIRIPADYNENTPYALWFTPHCMNGSAAGVAAGSAGTGYAYYGIWKFANPTGGKGTTIFCSPQGIGNAWGQGASDLTFFRYMINKFANELCIDMSRVFSEGFSMGGSMSYALACAMPDTMRAVCMHEGGSMSGCDGSHRGPVPMFITVGTQDSWPNMGPPQIADLAQRDGCTSMDIAGMVPGTINPPDQMHPVCVEYQNCNPGYPCRACIFNGGHNASPGTEGSWGEQNTWVPDSTWSFFKRFF